MHLRPWFQPPFDSLTLGLSKHELAQARPRRVLAVFLGVALASAAALGWLGWQLLAQDAALEIQRRQESIEQAADRAAAAMQRSMADLQARAGAQPGPTGSFPNGVSWISIEGSGVTVRPAGSLPYYPVSPRAPNASSEIFAAGELLEHAANDFAGAARAYSRVATNADPSIRAGALARLARVRRKQGVIEAALGSYDQLARIDDVAIDGLPAALVAHVGRASIFESASRGADLRQEAGALQRDLLRGRWQLLKSEYEFYSSQADQWLGAKSSSDVDAIARANAVEWLWQIRDSLATAPRRSVLLSEGPALVAWQSTPGRLDAIVAGPTYLAALCSEAVPAGLRCTLSDSEGRPRIGDRPAARMVATRTASATGLPWTLHLSATPQVASAPPSPRRRLLILTFAVVGLVLAAGWYFILRAISRELRVSRLQSDFVAAVSHEFRSPLTSLSHIAELLAHDRFPSDEARRKSFDILVRDTDRLRRLVEGLLDFGRFEAGAATLRLEPVDVTALVRSTVADFRERVAADGYSIELSGADEAVVTRADREALSRALWNLLDNAVKYSPECRIVWVEMTGEPDQVSIVVRDEGLGIPLHEQREIFDRFVRGADSKSRRIRGTGIGLAMVREIVRAHGGEIGLTSEPGRGSTFTIALPMKVRLKADPTYELVSDVREGGHVPTESGVRL
jgi:signal transduction histidine kinase